MRKLLFILIGLALTACGAPAPAEPTPGPAEPSPTPVVLLQTVVVTVIPTDVATEAPPPTAIPAPTKVPPTLAPEPAAAADAGGGLITLDEVQGAGWFAGMTRTADAFSLRCQLSKDITFSVKPLDPNIASVDFYYRIEDRNTGAVFDWLNAGRMLPDADGNFFVVFSGENVHPNFRKPNAWFDYQFIGVSRSGGVVGRSEKITRQVTYSLDCP